MSGKTRNVILLVGAVLLVTPGLLYLRWNMERRDNLPVAQKITCVNNLKQIGLAFRTWAIDHDGQYPFNVSTNAGGTRELCARGSDGFDSNAALHFRVMSNELSNPKVLVCPQDRSPTPTASFSKLEPENVTYRLRSGTNSNINAHPKEILAVCPIDGNTLYSDGTVGGKQEQPGGDRRGHPMPLP